MKLTRIEVRNYRSLFMDRDREPFTVELADGINAFIGPNNCGKSNVQAGLRRIGCRRCGGVYSLAFFRRGEEITDHRAQVTCIGCEREVRAATRASGAVRRKARNTLVYHADKFVGKGLAASREDFAVRFGWDVSRMIEDIGDAMKDPSPYCAELLTKPSQCALDIVDPGKPPYYRTNTRWICDWCNREKAGLPIHRWEDKLNDWTEWKRRHGDRCLDVLPLFGWANSGENLSLLD